MQLGAVCARGFLLIEVVVSLFLVALVAAGWLGVQASGLRQTRQSEHESMALLLASDMAERLRASPAQAAAMAVAQALPLADQASPSAVPCEVARCDAQAWAQADAAQWRALVRDGLPQGSAWVEVDALSRTARITLGWKEAPPPEGGHSSPATPLRACPAQWGDSLAQGLRCLSLAVVW